MDQLVGPVASHFDRLSVPAIDKLIYFLNSRSRMNGTLF
jgi:hypothetical protein